jgi:hypothetical protein
MVHAARFISLSFLLLAIGCGDDCNDIGCGSSLIVELGADQGFDDGDYGVVLESDLGTTVCNFTIAGGSASNLQCLPNDASVDSAELPGIVLIRYYQQQPSELSVTVERDGEELAAEDVTPEYEQVFPDSSACGGGCTSAQVSVGW